jgi:predicted ester cyclase
MSTKLVLDDLSSLRRKEVTTSQNTTEESKRIVRDFIEAAFNKHQPGKAGEYMTPDIKWHGGTLGTVEGRDNFVGLIGAIVTALPDLRNVELDIIAERDIVSVRAVVDGTHTGDLLGIPASGKHVKWDAIDNYRVVDGKIAEEWAADDLLAFVYGVGAYTPPWLASKA